MTPTEPDDVPTARVLSQRECWQYLHQHDVGRLAVNDRGDLAIYPVNYLAEAGTIRFRTAPGAKLLGLLLDSRVAFEVDAFDDTNAWSVLVKGTAEEIELPTDRPDALPKLPTKSWAPVSPRTYVQITPSKVTGRIFSREPAADA